LQISFCCSFRLRNLFEFSGFDIEPEKVSFAIVTPLSGNHRFRREDGDLRRGYCLLSRDAAKAAKGCRLVKAANDQRQIALSGELDGLPLEQIAAVIGEGQRFLESKMRQMARGRIGMRVAAEIAGHVFKEFAAGRIKSFCE
jgi:hypothetical protein